MKVYLLVSTGCWDGNFTDIDVYETEESVRRGFKSLVDETVNMYKDSYEEEELNITVYEKELYCEVILPEWGDTNRHEIYVIEREVL